MKCVHVRDLGAIDSRQQIHNLVAVLSLQVVFESSLPSIRK